MIKEISSSLVDLGERPVKASADVVATATKLVRAILVYRSHPDTEQKSTT